jgi:hypothetical protein
VTAAQYAHLTAQIAAEHSFLVVMFVWQVATFITVVVYGLVNIITK